MGHEVALGTHIAAGAVGLVVGPVAMWRETRRLRAGVCPFDAVSAGYRWAVLVTCASAIVLVVFFRADLWWLAPVAAASYALVFVGRWAVVRRFRGWSHAYVHGMGGSYIALVTALVVVTVTVDGPVRGGAQVIPWALPAVVGTVLIERWRRRLALPTPG
jgi:hypothetical protein